LSRASRSPREAADALKKTWVAGTSPARGRLKNRTTPHISAFLPRSEPHRGANSGGKMRVAKMPYVEPHRGSHRVRIVVPPRLVPIIGKKNLKKGLGTSNFAEAHKRAVPWIAKFQAQLDDAEAKLTGRETFRQMVDETAAVASVWFDEKVAEARLLLSGADTFRAAIAARIDALQLEDLKIPDTPPPVVGVPFEPVVDLWALKKNKLAKARDTRMSKMARLFAFLGHNDMSRVIPKDLSRYEEESLLPKVESGEWKHKTVRDHLIDIKATFRFAKEQQKIETNPAADLRTYDPDIDDSRDGIKDFDKAEIKAILAAARKSDDPVIKWANLLAGFHGARLAEIVEAQTNDIEIIDGVPVFHIRLDNRSRTQRIKTGCSTRRFPVHSAVLADGFLDYVEQVRREHGDEGPLFPTLRLDSNGRLNTVANKVIMTWLRKTVGVTDPLRRFHSWRHTVATILTDQGVPEVRARYITGHAPRTKGDKYVHHSISELRKAIERIPDPNRDASA
jgi:integrase